MRYEKEVAWKFFGDVEKAKKYLTQARTAAGEFFSTNVNELEQLTRRVQLAEDVWCQIKKIPGQVIIELHATTAVSEELDGKIAGFILKASDGKEGILSWDKVAETWKWIPRAKLSELAYGNVVSWKDTTRAISCNAAPERHFYDEDIGWSNGTIYLNGKALPEVDTLLQNEGVTALGGGYYEGWLYVVAVEQYSPYSVVVFAQEKPGGEWERSEIYGDFQNVTSAAVFSEDGSSAVVRLNDYTYANYTRTYFQMLLTIEFSSTGSATGSITHEDTPRYSYSYTSVSAKEYSCSNDFYETDPYVPDHTTNLSVTRNWYSVDFSYCKPYETEDWWDRCTTCSNFPIVHAHTEYARTFDQVPPEENNYCYNTGHPFAAGAGMFTLITDGFGYCQINPDVCPQTGSCYFVPEIFLGAYGKLACHNTNWSGSFTTSWYGGTEYDYKDCVNSHSGGQTLTVPSEYLIAQEASGFLTAGVVRDYTASTGASEYHYVNEWKNGESTSNFVSVEAGTAPCLGAPCYWDSFNCGCSNLPTLNEWGLGNFSEVSRVCDSRWQITTSEANASYTDTWGYRVTANRLGTVSDGTYSVVENDSGSCYSKYNYDCDGYTYCAQNGCADPEVDNSATFNESWTSDSSVTLTIGYDARCNAWLRAECTYFKDKSSADGSVIAGEGSSKIKLQLPDGTDVLIATIPVAIAYAGDTWAFEDFCSNSSSDAAQCLRCDKYHSFKIYLGICGCTAECYTNQSPYTCGYNNSGSSTSLDEYTPALFPRYSLFKTIDGDTWLGGIVSKWATQSNADILETVFQCNQDTFGHWMISVYLKIQEFIIVDYYYAQEVGDPIYLSYNWLSTGQDPIDLVNVVSDETHPAYFENVSVTGLRTL